MEVNRKILVVDDQEDLRVQVARMLAEKSAGAEANSLLEQIRSRLNKQQDTRRRGTAITYQVDTAGQGQAAYELVKNSFTEHRPYALMFLDMRMPPGWDGLETAQRVRSIDKEIQIVIMTAYADYDQHEISERIGEPDKLLYLKKPFHPEEIRQLALAMTEKWNMNRREKEHLILTNRLMRENSNLARHGFQSLEDTYNVVLDTFVSFLDAHVGVLVRRHQQELRVCAATNAEQGQQVLARLTPEQRNATRILTNDKDSECIFPISFPAFDGFMYLQGKNLIFSFEQLAPFIEILSETAREVLMNAFLLQSQHVEQQVTALSRAANRIAGRIGAASTQIGKQAAVLQKSPAPEQRDPAWRDLLAANATLARLANDLEELHALQNRALTFTMVDLSALLNALLLRYKPQLAAASVRLDAQITPGLQARGAADAIERAVARLLDNAIEAMVETPADKRLLTLIAAPAEGDTPRIHIAVGDSGTGIPAALAERLYDPFVAGDRTGAIGLGATLAKRIVELHQGSLSHAPGPQGGTTFHLLLPVLPN